jgi:hypothetical protein
MMTSNRIKTVLTTLTLAAVVMIGSGFNVAAEDIPAWRPLPSSQADGLLAQRVELWRHGRLWHMLAAEDDYLLSGFEKRPGKHPWQGEHVGKWLHAATLAYEQTHEKRLLEALQETVGRLLAAQEPNGYLGTYAEKQRFYMVPADNRRWDTWTHRYNLYGLLTYDRFHSDGRVVEACRKMADLLIEVYGEGKYDLTQYGTRQGIQERPAALLK